MSRDLDSIASPFRYLARAVRTHVPLKASRDVYNRVRYGRNAPLSDEPIHVDPTKVTRVYVSKPEAGAPVFRRRHSGLVMGGDWDLSLAPIGHSVKMEACRLHFADGLPWEETGIFEYAAEVIARKGQYDGSRTRAGIASRYARLDRMFEQARREGQFRLRRDLPTGFRREYGGIYVHVTRDGEVVSGGGGAHRLAVAQVLGFPKVPMQLGVIHPQAIEDGYLHRLREPGAQQSPAAVKHTQDQRDSPGSVVQAPGENPADGAEAPDRTLSGGV